jgi:hypothetical protein
MHCRLVHSSADCTAVSHDVGSVLKAEWRESGHVLSVTGLRVLWELCGNRLGIQQRCSCGTARSVHFSFVLVPTCGVAGCCWVLAAACCLAFSQ